MAEQHLLSKQAWVTVEKVCPGWALNIIQPAEVGFESDMGTDAVFKGQSAVSDTMYHHMLLDKIKYMRESQCILWVIQFLSEKDIIYLKRTLFPHNQQWFLCLTLWEELIVRATACSTTWECAWVCIIQHLCEQTQVHSHSRSIISASNICKCE